MNVEYYVITIPTVWSNNKSVTNDLHSESQKQIDEMRKLHESGFHVTQMTNFVLHEIAYVTYYLERK